MEIEVPISQRKIVKVKRIRKNSFSENPKDKTPRKKINFKDIFTLESKELIVWCLEHKILKKPTSCHLCRKRTRKIKGFRLSRSKNYLNKVVWRCMNRSCGCMINIRKGNKLIEPFSKVKLKFIFIV